MKPSSERIYRQWMWVRGLIILLALLTFILLSIEGYCKVIDIDCLPEKFEIERHMKEERDRRSYERVRDNPESASDRDRARAERYENDKLC